MGAELVGDDSVEADAEMLALVIESMLTIGLKEFQLCVGNVDFFQSIIEDANLDEEAEERVRELIGNRNYFGVEEFLDNIQAKRSAKEAFGALNELIGGVEILEKLKILHQIPKESWQSDVWRESMRHCVNMALKNS